MSREGALTISIDVELAWGRCDVPFTPGAYGSLMKERDIIRRILNLFAAYQIRATWAVVGHLLLTECQWADGCVHPEITRPLLTGEGRDWFFQHPSPQHQGDPLWYGRDIIELIRSASPLQEIGSHSFCHMAYDHRRTPRAAVHADIAAAQELHRAHRLPFDSFVFPRNVVGCKDLLASAGVKCYRGKTRHWYDAIPWRPIRRLLHLASYVAPTQPPTVTPRVDQEGLVNVPDSMLLMGRAGLRRLVSSGSLIRKGIGGLNRAAQRGEVFHLWFHPSNFSSQTDEQFRVLEVLLRHASELRVRGRLDILTMGDHARQLVGSAFPKAALNVVEDIRERAVAFHEGSAEAFKDLYDHMTQDYCASAFAYGRQHIEDCLLRSLKDLPSGSRILDVGCGTGDQLKLCRQLGFEVVGIEPSPRMRAIAETRNPWAHVMEGLIGALPFPEESFDFVLAIEVLRYLHPHDIQRAYREVFRVLKPGGRFFFTMVNRYALDGFYLYDRLRRWLAWRRESVVHCEFVTPGELERDLNSLGVRELTLQGRIVLPLRIAYKIHPRSGAQLARALQPLDVRLSQLRWTVPLAGHLIVVATRPASSILVDPMPSAHRDTGVVVSR